MKILTWNINSIRIRLKQLSDVIDELQPDIICLQETKVENNKFPLKDVQELGFKYVSINGQPSYNGVAIFTCYKLQDTIIKNFCSKEDSRYISAKIKHPKLDQHLNIHNFYVPAGGDEPDVSINPKFAHKIDFLNEMKSYFTENNKTQKILVGDLNIAPLENDVWSHKQLLNVVSHTPIETKTLLDIIASGDWVDVMREITPHDEKLYSWWSYRNRNWEISNRGRRLDHIWVSKKLFPQVKSGVIYKETRSWEKPSDHVPIIIDIDI